MRSVLCTLDLAILAERLTLVRQHQSQSARRGNPSLGWAPVREFPGFDVSQDGVVRSWWMFNAPDEPIDEPRELPVFKDADGYRRAALHRFCQARDLAEPSRPRGCKEDAWITVHQSLRVHRLLLPAFTRPAEPYEKILFRDDDITNVTLGNLAWERGQ